MKTDIGIRTDIYRHIRGSDLEKAVSGVVDINGRPDKSDKEDIVISIIGDTPVSQIQEVYLNVNVYVPDILIGTQYREDTLRTSELSGICYDVLKSGIGEGYKFSLESYRVFKVEGTNEHAINNKILYKFCND